MKFLHLNTASAFASDYKLFNYQARQSEWEPTEATPIELWDKHCPSGLAMSGHNLNLGCRSRSFSMWICPNDLGPGYFCAITITGIASESRKDFMGRIIYDSVSLTSISGHDSFDQDAPSFAREQANVALNALKAFWDKSWSLDGAANQGDFDKDLFAFSDIGRVYSSFSKTCNRDIRAGLTNEAGAAHLLVLQLLKRLNIDFCIEENTTIKRNAARQSRIGRDSLRDQIDESIGNMVETAEEIKDKMEDKFASVLGEKHTHTLLKPLRVMEGLLKRGPFAQVQKSASGPKRRGEESLPGINYSNLTCKNRPSLVASEQLQSELLNIWASHPSVAIGLSISHPTSESNSRGADIPKQGEVITITIP